MIMIVYLFSGKIEYLLCRVEIQKQRADYIENFLKKKHKGEYIDAKGAN